LRSVEFELHSSSSQASKFASTPPSIHPSILLWFALEPTITVTMDTRFGLTPPPSSPLGGSIDQAMEYTEVVEPSQAMQYIDDVEFPDGGCDDPLPSVEAPDATLSSAGNDQQQGNVQFQILMAAMQYKVWVHKCLADPLFFRVQWARLHGVFYSQYADPSLSMFRKAEVSWTHLKWRERSELT